MCLGLARIFLVKYILALMVVFSSKLCDETTSTSSSPTCLLVLPHLSDHHTRFCSHSLLCVVIDKPIKTRRRDIRLAWKVKPSCIAVLWRRSCRKLTRRQPAASAATFSRRPLIFIPPLPTSKTSCATSAVSATASYRTVWYGSIDSLNRYRLWGRQ